jgi:hypothetical protein
MIRYKTGEQVRLIFACAWCPKDTYTLLRKDEEYTHGVCNKHLRLLLRSLKKRGGKFYKEKYAHANS